MLVADKKIILLRMSKEGKSTKSSKRTNKNPGRSKRLFDVSHLFPYSSQTRMSFLLFTR
jgi:hypothetical protein